ncbi:glycosyltransferase family 4 protein [Psychroflexus aestuariivivens]|uniref:glycosyltransferase family 4 protein n=1 Tax=Psychroflexus aestuariivivens TaxID=1795040 RepID=UPI000FD778DB|nr:glycosyltransferase family 1 protein [Psychroflexus aestuariivivens]
MSTVFLESHNIKNPYFGFGQFNYHLLNAFAKNHAKSFAFTAHVKNINHWKNEFGNDFNFKKYFSWRRYPALRIRKKYDIWHSLNQNTKIEPFYNLPYLLTVHNITHIKNPNDYFSESEHIRFQEKLKRSHAITYISEYAKKSTHEFFEVPKVQEYVIYNGNPITQETLKKDFTPKINPDKPFLFSIGEFTKRKNFESLIHLIKEIPEYQLIIAGKNSTKTGEDILNLIKKEGLEHRVHIPGIVSDQAKQYYYKHCSAFLFPSLREGFGLPVIEAMRFKKPVFISNNTSLPEIGGELAFYWNNYDPIYMAKVFEEGMEKFLENKSVFENKLLTHSQQFSWKKAAESYCQVYNELLKL